MLSSAFYVYCRLSVCLSVCMGARFDLDWPGVGGVLDVWMVRCLFHPWGACLLACSLLFSIYALIGFSCRTRIGVSLL